MYEMIKLSEHDYYMDCPSRVGFSLLDGENVILFDTGNNRDYGKRILRVIDENGWHLVAIYCTHSHGDHIGGNQYLQEKTGCKIYGLPLDYCYSKIRDRAMLYFSVGAPSVELRARCLVSSVTKVTDLTPEAMPEGYSYFELFGHSIDQVAYKTPDGNLFVGDAVTSIATLEKYAICYLFDVQAYLDSLVKLRDIEAVNYIPSHAPHFTDIHPVVDFNIEVVNKLISEFETFFDEKITYEDFSQIVFDTYGINMNDSQFVVVGSTLCSYIAYLCRIGKIGYVYENKKRYFVKKEKIAE